MQLMSRERIVGSTTSSYDIDIEADDINITDTVTVVWSIL